MMAAMSQPQFNLSTRSFLQDRMIDVGAGAYPVFCDIDQDGLMDLLIGNYGYYDTSYYDQFMYPAYGSRPARLLT